MDKKITLEGLLDLLRKSKHTQPLESVSCRHYVRGGKWGFLTRIEMKVSISQI